MDSLDENIERSILLAMQAVKTTHDTDGFVLPEAANALHEAINSSRLLISLPQGNAVDISTDGKYIATAGEDGTAILWTADTGQEILTLKGHTGPLHAIAFDSEGKQLATAGEDGSIIVWDTVSGEATLTLTGHPGGIHDVSFSPNGQYLASSGDESAVKIFDLASGEEAFNLEGFIDPYASLVLSVAYSPDGKYLLATGRSNHIRMWATDTGQEILNIAYNWNWATGAAFTTVCADLPESGEQSCGTRLITSSSDREVGIFDVDSGQKKLAISFITPVEVKYLPEGNHLAVASIGTNDAALYALNTDGDEWTSTKLFTLTGHTAGLTDVDFSPNSKILATSSWDSTVKIWDGLTGEEIHTIPAHDDMAMGVAFSPNGTHLAMTGADGLAKIWDVSSGQQIITMTGHGGVGEDSVMVIGVRYDASGRKVVTSSFDGTARVWDAETGEEILSLIGHSGGVHQVAISPDGSLFATSSDDGTAKVWDATTGEELLTLTGHRDRLWDLHFSPDGRFLATSSSDGTVRFYLLNIADVLALAESRVPRGFTEEESQIYLHLESCPPAP